jgi:hypothetical protein
MEQVEHHQEHSHRQGQIGTRPIQLRESETTLSMVDDKVDGETAATGRWAKEIDTLTPILNQN